MQDGDGMRNCGRKQWEISGEHQRDQSWQQDASVIGLIEAREDMVAKMGRQRRARRRETWNWKWKETEDLAEVKANPATRMEGVATKRGGSRAHAELPRVTAPIQGKSRDVSAAGQARSGERLTKMTKQEICNLEERSSTSKKTERGQSSWAERLTKGQLQLMPVTQDDNQRTNLKPDPGWQNQKLQGCGEEKGDGTAEEESKG